MDADSPLLTLASAIEIRNALSMSDPAEYISHLPVHQDGSCNGLQHYAALGRDFQGGQVVNLLPSEKPQDVYSAVAERYGGNKDTGRVTCIVCFQERFITNIPISVGSNPV